MLGLDIGMFPWLVSAQYCARQGATAYLILWAFLLVLIGAAMLIRSNARVMKSALLVFALLTSVLGVSMFYGCSIAAPSEQGLGTTMAAGVYTTLRCLGYEVFGTATGWIVTATECIAAIALFSLARVRWKKAGRVFGYIGSGVLLILTVATGFLAYFGFAWCTSARLF